MGKQFLKLAGVAALALAFAVPAQASTISFDPDGAAGANGSLTVTSFDWAPGNNLNLDSVTAIQNFLAGGTGAAVQFDALFQARLAGLNGPGGPIVVPGLNAAPYGTGSAPAGFTPFEITIVARFREEVTFVGGPGNSIATFSVVPSVTSFFEIWFDDGSVAGATPSSDLAGTGFQDGQLILTGSLTAGLSTFTASDLVAPFPNLDGFTGDDYPFIDSIAGAGSSDDISGPVSGTLASFFTLLPPLFINLSLTDTQQNVPFDSVNPSDRFVTSGLGAVGTTNGVNTSVDLGASPGGVGTIGPINGISGPDFQLETDAQTEFQVVPEPSTLVLGVIAGALGLGHQVRRLRRKQAARA